MVGPGIGAGGAGGDAGAGAGVGAGVWAGAGAGVGAGVGFWGGESPLPLTLTNLHCWRPLPSSFSASDRYGSLQSELALKYRVQPAAFSDWMIL